MFDLRLIRADAMKLRRRRGMLALCLIMTLGIVVLMVVVAAIQHAGNAPERPPAGGLMAYTDVMFIQTLMMLVVGTIVGAVAGAQDLESGVFRDLAATGRSRVALFAARAPAAWAIVLPIGALSCAVATVAAFVLADGAITPDAGKLVATTAGVLTSGVLTATMAAGFATVAGSKAPVIAAMLAVDLALAPLLSGIAWLGDARQAIPTNAVFRIGEGPNQGVEMGLVTAIAVAVLWAATAFAAGAWRTRTREI